MQKFSVLKLLPPFKPAARPFKPAAGQNYEPNETAAAPPRHSDETISDGLKTEQGPSPALIAFYERHERFKRGRGG